MDTHEPRGPVGDHLIVRLADEGVPLCAIARVVKRPYADIVAIVDGAVAQCLISTRPPTDWPHGHVRYVPSSVAEIHAKNQEGLRGIEAALEAIPYVFRLTRKEAQTFAALLLRPRMATKNFLHSAVYGLDPNGGAEPKIVDVFMCKIRRKIEPHGVQVGTVWGRGYQIEAEHLRRVAELKRREEVALLGAGRLGASAQGVAA